jgi:hypothetical protein
MSIVDWYDDKAEQCVRQAADAADAKQRATLRQEAVFWRQIGADVLRQDKKISLAHAGNRPEETPRFNGT